MDDQETQSSATNPLLVVVGVLVALVGLAIATVVGGALIIIVGVTLLGWSLENKFDEVGRAVEGAEEGP